jgi:hypothetical protein
VTAGGGGGGGSTPTGSLLTTASVNLNTITFTKGDGSTFPITVNTGSEPSRIVTGSVTASVTPSQFTITSGSSTEFQVTGTGVTLGGASTDVHNVTGSLNVSGSVTATSFTGSLQVASLPKVSRPVIRITTPASSGNNTSEQNITSISIPANSLAVGDIIRLGAVYSFASNTGTKTPRVRFGLNQTGTTILYGPSTLAASITGNTIELIGIVTSTTNLRMTPSSTVSGLGTGTGATINHTIDTASTVSFSFNVQKSVGTDTAVLEFAWVEILTA